MSVIESNKKKDDNRLHPRANSQNAQNSLREVRLGKESE